MGRKGQHLSQRERTARKIRAALVAQRVERCALGQEEMTTEELRAAQMLLDRTVPRLNSVDPGTDDEPQSVHEYTPEQLLQVLDSEGESIHAVLETPHRGLLDGVGEGEESIPPLPDKKISYTGAFVDEQTRAATCKQATELTSPHAMPPCPDGYVYGKPSVRGQSVPLVKIGSPQYEELVAEGFIKDEITDV